MILDNERGNLHKMLRVFHLSRLSSELPRRISLLADVIVNSFLRVISYPQSLAKSSPQRKTRLARQFEPQLK
jgi:hypothetical protein